MLKCCSEVWGTYEAEDIEIVHKKNCRWVLSVKKSTNLVGLYGELGRVPMIIYRKFNRIKYWYKLLKSNETSIPGKTYDMLKNVANNNITYNGSNRDFQLKW